MQLQPTPQRPSFAAMQPALCVVAACCCHLRKLRKDLTRLAAVHSRCIEPSSHAPCLCLQLSWPNQCRDRVCLVPANGYNNSYVSCSTALLNVLQELCKDLTRLAVSHAVHSNLLITHRPYYLVAPTCAKLPTTPAEGPGHMAPVTAPIPASKLCCHAARIVCSRSLLLSLADSARTSPGWQLYTADARVLKLDPEMNLHPFKIPAPALS